MKKNPLTLILIAAIFMMPLLSLEASADTASGSAGAGYGTLCSMPGQCESGKCLRQLDGSFKCGCKYNRECGTNKICNAATGICIPDTGAPKLSYGAACRTGTDCMSGYCFVVRPEITPPDKVCGCGNSAECSSFPGTVCNPASHRCVSSSATAVGTACRSNTNCLSGLCKSRICACGNDDDCGTGRTCNPATGQCSGAGSSETGAATDLDRLIAEINALIASMKARVGRI